MKQIFAIFPALALSISSIFHTFPALQAQQNISVPSIKTTNLPNSEAGTLLLDVLNTENIAPEVLEEIPASSTENTSSSIFTGTLATHNTHIDFYPTEEQYTFISEPLSTSEFNVAGVTWQGNNMLRADVRVLQNDTWSQWQTLEIENSEDPNIPSGTEAFIAADASGIQIRTIFDAKPHQFNIALMTGASGATQTAPTTGTESKVAPTQDTELETVSNPEALNPEVELILENATLPTTNPLNDLFTNPKTFSNKVFTQLNTLFATSNTIKAPKIITRSQWNAPSASWKPSYDKLKGAILHHTAGINNYSKETAPEIVRAIFQYHANTLDWGDIGYNFLIDKYGTIYEGRAGSYTAAASVMTRGAHALHANPYSVGVSVLGNYTNGVKPTDASIRAIEDVIAWRFALANLDPYSTWSTGKETISTIAGHKDVSATACPGHIYDRLSEIRKNVKTKIATYKSGQVPNTSNTPTGWPKIANPTAGWNWGQWHDGKGYYFYLDANLQPKPGWLYDKNKWYYIDEYGRMATGWVDSNGKKYYLNSEGEMLTGLQTISNAKYIFDSQGAMQTGWITHNKLRYYADLNGKLATGWRGFVNKWYFFNSEAVMQTGIIKDNGKYYYLNSEGVMQTGWITHNSQKYFASSKGDLLTGWQKINQKWYLFTSTGAMRTGFVTDNAKRYYLGTDGILQTGWITTNNQKYWANSSGELVKGWQTIANSRYFFHRTNYYALTGTQVIDGVRYSFSKAGVINRNLWLAVNNTWYRANDAGVLVTGWQKIDGSWYYFNPNSQMHTGWLHEAKHSYYLTNSGAMATGLQTINGKSYIFNTSGALVKGEWIQHAGSWYYPNPKGEPLTGWQKLGNTWYYFQPTGKMHTGWLKEGNAYYYLNSSGAMLTGTHTINGTRYRFDSSGRLI